MPDCDIIVQCQNVMQRPPEIPSKEETMQEALPVASLELLQSAGSLSCKEFIWVLLPPWISQTRVSCLERHSKAGPSAFAPRLGQMSNCAHRTALGLARGHCISHSRKETAPKYAPTHSTAIPLAKGTCLASPSKNGGAFTWVSWATQFESEISMPEWMERPLRNNLF